MPINGTDLARMIDSTNISTTATKQEIDEMIEQAKEYRFFAINGPTCYFLYLVDQLRGSDVKPGFGCSKLSGSEPTHCKAYAAKWAVENGADEIDMAMNITYFKSGMFREVVQDVRTVKDAIGDKALKLILECPLLTDGEVAKATELAIEGGADCIKTCTGMEGPVTLQNIETIARVAQGRAWIKASGGIRDISTVDRFLDLGVARFGMNYRAAKAVCDQANAR